MLGLQAPLQAIGEARYDALHLLQLLVEILPQSLQLISIAQLFGFNGLVKFCGEHIIGRFFRV